MKTFKKYWLLFVLIVFVVMAFFLYKEFQRKPTDLIYIESDAKVGATTIAELYEANETKANKQYLNKIIEVSGRVVEIVNQQDTFINIIMGDALSMHKVSCLLDKVHFIDIRNYKVGQQINIKGICTGFLIDVELNRCVVINKK